MPNRRMLLNRSRLWPVSALVGLVVLNLGFLGNSSAIAAGNWASSLFNEHSHDFGPVARGAIVRHPFVLTNRFAEPITIVDIRVSCGCTSARASSSSVPPGGQAIIEAQMDTRNFVGDRPAVITIVLARANGQQTEARLRVRSRILSDIVLNPGAMDFGTVSSGQPASQTLTIDRIGAPGWKVERMIASQRLSQVVDAQIVETTRSGQNVGYQLTVSLRADAPAGPIREEIRILTNDRESPVVPVLVAAEIRGALSASPSLLALGRANSSDGVQGRFLVRGTRPFAITKIEGEGDGFTIEAAEPNTRKAIQILTVTYQPDGSAVGEISRSFRVHTDLSDEPALELHATARVDP